MTGAHASPAQIVHAWAAESKDYDYKSNRCKGTCGTTRRSFGGTPKKSDAS